MGKPFAWIAVLLLGSCLAEVRLTETSWAQVAAPLYGAHGISPQAVRQGYLGSCYFHASIAALAQAAPNTLRGAISQDSGGGYRVRFKDGPAELVYPEDVEYGRSHGYDRSDGTWVAVLMRAYAQRALRQGLVSAIQKSDSIPAFTKPMALSLLGQYGLLLVAYDRAVRSVVSQDGSMDQASLKQSLTSELHTAGVPAATAQALVGFLDDKGFFLTVARTVQEDGEVFGAYKSLGMGGIPVRVIEAFMGKAYAGPVADHAMTMEELRLFRAGHVAMVAGTWSTANSGDSFSKMDSWVPAHCYTILKYDEAAQTVTLRNPWGTHPDPDGVFMLPLAVFLKGFESYSHSASAAQ
ncbi:MAG: hypothetical protein ABSE51_18855 [Terracidiphilus sp.]